MAQRPSFTVPTPTPPPQSVVDAVQEFSEGLGSANRDWDLLRLEYDNWQADLTSCDPSAIGLAQGRFSSMFAGLSQEAKALPRTSATRQLADKLISAAEAEEAALRSFDDYGNDSLSSAASSEPGAPGPESKAEEVGEASARATESVAASGNADLAGLFDQVYQARSTSRATLQEVSDAIADWEARSSDSGRRVLGQFSEAFHAVNGRWDAFHQEYEAFRAEASYSSGGRAVRQLSALIVSFGEVVLATRDLSKYEGAGHIADLMAETAEAEDLALRVLRASQQTGEEVASASPGALSLSLSSPKPTATPGTEGTIGGGSGSGAGIDSEAYEAFETQLVAANTARRAALEALNELAATLDEEQLGALASFKERYNSLLAEWAEFHREYDAWRAEGSGCNSVNAVQTLTKLNTQYGRLGGEVGNLPISPVLRPMGELMVEAVRREGSAMQNLRDDWRPFEPGVYMPYRQARIEADRMRRQVAAGIQDLLDQYGISSR